VAIGGIGAMAVAGIWSRVFPQLREQDSLDKRMPDPAGKNPRNA
jgi:hypothetical protein